MKSTAATNPIIVINAKEEDADRIAATIAWALQQQGIVVSLDRELLPELEEDELMEIGASAIGLQVNAH